MSDTLKTISENLAREQGYRPITTGMHPRRDKEILDSMAATLSGCDAVWIKRTTGLIEAGRKFSPNPKK